MTWPLLQLSAAFYLGGLAWFQRQRWQLVLYIWSVFGFIFVFIHLAVLQGWDKALSSMEARHVQAIMGVVGVKLELIDASTFLVPDSTGWSGLNVGIECSTIIELAVYAGLILFYPKLSMQRRWTSLVIGVLGTYLLNLARIILIVVMIVLWGKPVVPLAHTVVGRLVYFFGVVVLYWYLLTTPTLYLVRRYIETTGRAVR